MNTPLKTLRRLPLALALTLGLGAAQAADKPLLGPATGALPAAPTTAPDTPSGPRVATAEAHENERWLAIREGLFGKRPIQNLLDAKAPADAVVALDVPIRAADAAVVPMTIRTLPLQTAERHVKKVWLVIDRNPSPVGAVFTLTPQAGRAELATRVRVEEYTHVRAIAELNDGSLHMHTRFLKASGGCSAAPGSDLAAAKATLGRFKLRLDPVADAAGLVAAQLSISHPNVSGLAIDQLTRLAPPPHFVRQVEVSYDGKPVVTADVDFTLSENPYLKFHFKAGGAGDLKVTVRDTEDGRYEQTLALGPGGQPVATAAGAATTAAR